MSALPAAVRAAMPRAGTAAMQSPSEHVSPQRTAKAEAKVEGGGVRAGGTANGNGDGPARVAGNGATEAKCDSAAHGEGAQVDRAAQAEADCAGAEANRAQAEPEMVCARAEADGRAKANGAADGARALAGGARAKVDAKANGIKLEIGDEGTVGGGRSTAAGERGHGGMSDAEGSIKVPCTNTGDASESKCRGDVGAQIGNGSERRCDNGAQIGSKDKCRDNKGASNGSETAHRGKAAGGVESVDKGF
jgi:hypothetical protein